mmetsp:Transcript_39682/g.114161  ORF Transcript_39682/g.114161 Transcript_39682/m.114161 type:complete len:223 (+) Transcript_39682:644-1312(+)
MHRAWSRTGLGVSTDRADDDDDDERQSSSRPSAPCADLGAKAFWQVQAASGAKARWRELPLRRCGDLAPRALREVAAASSARHRGDAKARASGVSKPRALSAHARGDLALSLRQSIVPPMSKLLPSSSAAARNSLGLTGITAAASSLTAKALPKTRTSSRPSSSLSPRRLPAGGRTSLIKRCNVRGDNVASQDDDPSTLDERVPCNSGEEGNKEEFVVVAGL